MSQTRAMRARAQSSQPETGVAEAQFVPAACVASVIRNFGVPGVHRFFRPMIVAPFTFHSYRTLLARLDKGNMGTLSWNPSEKYSITHHHPYKQDRKRNYGGIEPEMRMFISERNDTSNKSNKENMDYENIKRRLT
jgi:hypothetical protein